MPIIQIYIPYWEWEEWLNGMWGKSVNEEEDLAKAIAFTGDYIKYGNAMKEVIEAWPRTMLNSLTNMSINPRAFLGHCAVCFKIQIPEYITRMAWKQLTYQQRYDADKVAQETVDKWRSNYANKNTVLHKNMGAQMLF